MAKKKKAVKKKSKSIPDVSRKTALRAKERDKLKKLLRYHFGAPFVKRELYGAFNVKDETKVLKRLKKQMDEDIEKQKMDIEDYFNQIDVEIKKIGRPKSVFNERELRLLCNLQCNMDEIAGFFQMHPDTLGARVKEEYGMTFSEFYELNCQGAKVSLRRRQFMAAMDGDSSMLKFLGKNMLGQKDKVDFDGQVKVNSWVDLVNNLEKDENEQTENKEE